MSAEGVARSSEMSAPRSRAYSGEIIRSSGICTKSGSAR